MAPSDQSGRTRLFAVVVAAWLLFGAVAGIPAAAASDATGAATLGDDDGGLLNETLDSTTDSVDSTVDGTTSTVDSTVDSTTDTVDSTVEETGDTLDSTTGGATDDTTDSIQSATDGVTDATETTTDEVTETVDTTSSTVNATADDTTDAVSAAADGDLEGTSDSLTDATGEVTDLTTDRITSLAETTGTVTTELTDGTTDAVTELTGGTALDSTDETVDSVAGSPSERLSTGTGGDAVSSGQAARLETGSDEGADGMTDGSGDGSAEDAGGERSVATGSGGPLVTLGGADGLPVSEDAATGLGLGALLLGAVGIAVRQASAAGGTGAGTTVARAAALASDGPLSRLARMLSVFRYSRYDDSDPLELDARREVYEAISDQPGEPITAVSDRADVNLSTARHHVKVLQREGLVATARVRNCERFYPAGTDDLELAAAMADECTADILDALVRMEPASVSGLADEVDRSPSTVTHHLQKLEDDDIVVRERAGRSVENKLSAPARAALDPETERRQHAAERRLEADRSDATSGATAD